MPDFDATDHDRAARVDRADAQQSTRAFGCGWKATSSHPPTSPDGAHPYPTGTSTEDKHASSTDNEVPIEVLDGVVGALGVRGDSQQPLTGEEHELLESISRQASEALQRARLLDEARQRAQRERLIRDITDKMQRATDLQSLARIAAEELVSALGATRVDVRIGTPEELVQE
jgi:hypothetical protein